MHRDGGRHPFQPLAQFGTGFAVPDRPDRADQLPAQPHRDDQALLELADGGDDEDPVGALQPAQRPARPQLGDDVAGHRAAQDRRGAGLVGGAVPGGVGEHPVVRVLDGHRRGEHPAERVGQREQVLLHAGAVGDVLLAAVEHGLHQPDELTGADPRIQHGQGQTRIGHRGPVLLAEPPAAAPISAHDQRCGTGAALGDLTSSRCCADPDHDRSLGRDAALGPVVPVQLHGGGLDRCPAMDDLQHAAAEGLQNLFGEHTGHCISVTMAMA